MTRQKINDWYITYCYKHKIPLDLYDIESKIDENLSFDENINIIEEELSQLAEDGTLLEEYLRQQKVESERPIEQHTINLNLELTDSIAIVGDRNSGKTNLAFSLMNNYKGSRSKYLYGYPKNIDGYNTIRTWGNLLKISDSIIFIDEIQRYIPLYEKKANHEFMELLSFLSHQNNTLIFTTQLSQFITKGVEASIQTWFIKQLDIMSLKNGCKIKRILQETASPQITKRGMNLSINQYIAHDDTMPISFNGIHTFKDQGIMKDWKTPTKTAQENIIKTAIETPTKKIIETY